MDDQSNPQQAWQPQPQTSSSPSTPEVYTPYAHQIPEHGSPDPVANTPAPVYVAPAAPRPIYTPEPIAQQSSFTPLADTAQPVLSSSDDRPVPVVKVLSVRGIEYAMMSILLWFWSGSLIIILVSLIMGGAGFAELSFPVSLLLIAVPGFTFFYIRLRKAELRDPSLRLEASKRRFSQITQIVAFLTCFFNLVALVFVIMSKIGGQSTTSIPKFIESTAVILLIAGGILAYYWFDEHKLVRK